MKKAVMSRFAKLEGYNHERDGIKIPQQPKVCHAIHSALRELKESGEALIDITILEQLKFELDEMIADQNLDAYFTHRLDGEIFGVVLREFDSITK